MKLYHGTTNVEEVLEEGLIPNKDRNYEASVEGAVYLTDTPELARGFGIVVEVWLPDTVYLKPDKACEGPGCLYFGRIPPGNIQLYDKPIESSFNIEPLVEGGVVEREEFREVFGYELGEKMEIFQ